MQNDTNKLPHHIVLIGFMGTGKTTVGKMLSQMLGRASLDVDQLVEAQMNMPVSRIFERYGEKHFRELEHSAVAEISQSEEPIILCTGGGVVLNRKNIEYLKRNGVIIWLQASPETIYQRISEEATRPLLRNDMSVQTIQRILSERYELYAEAGDINIPTDNRTVEVICHEIIERLEGRVPSFG